MLNQHLVYEIVNGYKQVGLSPIAIKSSSKLPIGYNWNKRYKVKDIIYLLKNCTDYNIGTLLGDIIDIEADTPKANQFLDDCLKDIPHPIYVSSKSKHHLFKNKFKWLTRIVVNKIEFRAYKHQSVLPPSVHPNGTIYKWIETNNFTFPQIPNCLCKIIQDNRYRCLGRKTPPKKSICIKCSRKFFSIDQGYLCDTCVNSQPVYPTDPTKLRIIKILDQIRDCYGNLFRYYPAKYFRDHDEGTITTINFYIPRLNAFIEILNEDGSIPRISRLESIITKYMLNLISVGKYSTDVDIIKSIFNQLTINGNEDLKRKLNQVPLQKFLDYIQNSSDIVNHGGSIHKTV